MSVHLNDFKVEILASNIRFIKKSEFNYYALPDHSDYSIRIENNKNVRCDVEITIDNESVGQWRLRPYSSAIIRRPAEIDRKFVFVSDTSHDAFLLGAIHGDSRNGLITVTFKPERVYRPCCFCEHHVTDWMYEPIGAFSSTLRNASNGIRGNLFDECQMKSMDSGVTILGGSSGQSFSTASPIYDYDSLNETKIHVRLVVNKNSSNSEYMSLHDYSTHSTRIPPLPDW
jgi:hypothetical protein